MNMVLMMLRCLRILLDTLAISSYSSGRDCMNSLVHCLSVVAVDSNSDCSMFQFDNLYFTFYSAI